MRQKANVRMFSGWTLNELLFVAPAVAGVASWVTCNILGPTAGVAIGLVAIPAAAFVVAGERWRLVIAPNSVRFERRHLWILSARGQSFPVLTHVDLDYEDSSSLEIRPPAGRRFSFNCGLRSDANRTKLRDHIWDALNAARDVESAKEGP